MNKRNIWFIVFLVVVISWCLGDLYLIEKRAKAKEAARIREIKSLAYYSQMESDTKAEKELRAMIFMHEIRKIARAKDDSHAEAVRKVAEAIRDK